MMKFRKKALVAAGLTALSVGAYAEEKIAIGELSWDGARAIGYVMKAVIELRLGGEAEMKKSEAAIIMASMDKGDGRLDVYPNLWMPNK